MEQVQMVTRIVTVHEEIFTKNHIPVTRDVRPTGLTFNAWLANHEDWNQFHVAYSEGGSGLLAYGYHSTNGPEVTKWLEVEWQERA